MSYEYSEDNLIENATRDVLEELGWEVRYAWTKETFGPQGSLGRENKSEVVLKRYLRAALERFNPGLPDSAYGEAIAIIEQKTADKTLARINQEKYRLLKDGVTVSYHNRDGELEKKRLAVFDFDEAHNNHCASPPTPLPAENARPKVLRRGLFRTRTGRTVRNTRA